MRVSIHEADHGHQSAERKERRRGLWGAVTEGHGRRGVGALIIRAPATTPSSLAAGILRRLALPAALGA